MKGSMKKLAAFVTIAAITMFIAAAMASAGSSVPKAIRGQFAATTESSCILSIFGFNSDFTPACVPTPTGPLCIAIIQLHNRWGVYTFENDGTGSATLNGTTINLSYVGLNGQVPPSGGSATISYDFNYSVTDDGMITITQEPGTDYVVTFTSGPNKGQTYYTEGLSLKGAITPDGKNITLNGGPPNVLTLSGPNIPPNFGPNHLCQSSSVLIWQHDIVKK